MSTFREYVDASFRCWGDFLLDFNLLAQKRMLSFALLDCPRNLYVPILCLKSKPKLQVAFMRHLVPIHGHGCEVLAAWHVSISTHGRWQCEAGCLVSHKRKTLRHCVSSVITPAILFCGGVACDLKVRRQPWTSLRTKRRREKPAQVPVPSGDWKKQLWPVP